VFILTHTANFPCGWKPEHPEKTHDFRQSVDGLFSHESVVRIEPTISEAKGACSDDCALVSARIISVCVSVGIVAIIGKLWIDRDTTT
jgi:hypothetical protein